MVYTEYTHSEQVGRKLGILVKKFQRNRDTSQCIIDPINIHFPSAGKKVDFSLSLSLSFLETQNADFKNAWAEQTSVAQTGFQRQNQSITLREVSSIATDDRSQYSLSHI